MLRSVATCALQGLRRREPAARLRPSPAGTVAHRLGSRGDWRERREGLRPAGQASEPSGPPGGPLRPDRRPLPGRALLRGRALSRRRRRILLSLRGGPPRRGQARDGLAAAARPFPDLERRQRRPLVQQGDRRLAPPAGGRPRRAARSAHQSVPRGALGRSALPRRRGPFRAGSRLPGRPLGTLDAVLRPARRDPVPSYGHGVLQPALYLPLAQGVRGGTPGLRRPGGPDPGLPPAGPAGRRRCASARARLPLIGHRILRAGKRASGRAEGRHRRRPGPGRDRACSWP